MKKHHQTESLPQHQYLLLGMVSEVPAYKLCYELNRALSLALKWVALPGALATPQTSSEAPLTLFADANASADPGPQHWFEDLETDPDVEYILTDGRRDRLPQLAKPFPYFFVVRYLHPHPGPDTYAILQTLSQSPLIRSTVDLSDHLSTNHILP